MVKVVVGEEGGGCDNLLLMMGLEVRLYNYIDILYPVGGTNH